MESTASASPHRYGSPPTTPRPFTPNPDTAGRCIEVHRGYDGSDDDVADDEMILDIGPLTAIEYSEIIAGAGTIIWNGPVGVFEFDQFGEGTRVLAEAIAASDGFSIAGGGDTLAAIDKYDVADQIGYISTGGGAFLEFVEGKTLPAVAILQERNNQS